MDDIEICQWDIPLLDFRLLGFSNGAGNFDAHRDISDIEAVQEQFDKQVNIMNTYHTVTEV